MRGVPVAGTTVEEVDGPLLPYVLLLRADGAICRKRARLTSAVKNAVSAWIEAMSFKCLTSQR